MLGVLKVISFVARNRFYLYLALGVGMACFTAGAYVSYKITKGLNQGATIRAIKQDIENKGELDEIRNNRPDSIMLFDILRNGEY